MTAKSPARFVRWACRLSEFDLEIKYLPGRKNKKADLLSRLPIYQTEFESSETMPDRMFVSAITRSAPKTCVTDATAASFRLVGVTSEAIRNAQLADPILARLISKYEDSDPSSEYIVDESGILLKISGDTQLLVVPEKLRTTVLNYYHSHAIAAHLSKERLMHMLKSRFIWEGMWKDVDNWIQSCSCQAIKRTRPLQNGLLQPIVATRRGQIWEIDLVGPISQSSNGNKYMLVAIDCFSNWPVAAPLKTMTANEVVRLFFKLIIKDHGCPEAILSDMGTQFMSDAFKELTVAYNIKQLQASAYHHQTAGKIEKFIRFLKTTMATITPQDYRQTWDEYIDHALLAYRMSVSRVLGDTPFFMTYGRDPVLPQDLAFNLKRGEKEQEAAGTLGHFQHDLVNKMKAVYETLNVRRQKYQSNYKLYYDKQHKNVEFKIGDQVLILFDAESKNFLVPRWEGPFKIVSQLSPVTYRVENAYRLFVAHVQRMTPHVERQVTAVFDHVLVERDDTSHFLCEESRPSPAKPMENGKASQGTVLEMKWPRPREVNTSSPEM
jgi:transposase InsO family protein